MKNVFFLLFLMIFPAFLFAQITEEPHTMSLGVQNALVLDLPDTDSKLISQNWKTYLKEYGKVKYNRKAKEWYLMRTKISPIDASDKIDIYMQSDDNQIIVYIDFGDEFLTKKHPSYDNAVDFLKAFELEVEIAKIQKELEEEEKSMKKLEKQQTILNRNEIRYNKTIENAKNKIVQYEEKLIKNKEEQIAIAQKIEEQKLAVDAVKKKLDDTTQKGK